MPSLLHYFLGFSGRIERSEFWFGNGVIAFAAAAYLLVAETLSFGLWIPLFYAYTMWITSGWFSFLRMWLIICEFGTPVTGGVMLILLWPTFALQVKRWRDRGRSPLWIFFAFVPVIGALWSFYQLALRGTAED